MSAYIESLAAPRRLEQGEAIHLAFCGPCRSGVVTSPERDPDSVISLGADEYYRRLGQLSWRLAGARR